MTDENPIKACHSREGGNPEIDFTCLLWETRIFNLLIQEDAVRIYHALILK
jgi:hypothetical protein